MMCRRIVASSLYAQINWPGENLPKTRVEGWREDYQAIVNMEDQYDG
jgi:hypothetical protein